MREMNFNGTLTELCLTQISEDLTGRHRCFRFTRLTHSLECASVGRSLGTLIGNKLREKSLIGDHEGWEIGALVSAACLAHDISNTPFGHSGEKAIKEFFNRKLGDEMLRLFRQGKDAVISRLSNADD